MIPPRKPTLTQFLRDHLDLAMEELRVAQPARVETYDADSGFASVTLLQMKPVHEENGDVTWKAFKRMDGIPVGLPIGGGRGIKLPVTTGDIVLLVFCDFNLDDWKAAAPGDNGVVQPATLGTHQVGDAIAIPMLWKPGKLGDVSWSLELKDDGTVLLGEGASHPLIFGDDFSSAGGAFDTLMQAIAAAVGTSGTPAGATAAAVSIVAALTAYRANVTTKLSGNKTA